MARYHIVSMSLLYSPTSAADRSRRSRLRKTVDFTIEPRPSGAVIPGAFTHSFFNGALLKADVSRLPTVPDLPSSDTLNQSQQLIRPIPRPIDLRHQRPIPPNHRRRD